MSATPFSPSLRDTLHTLSSAPREGKDRRRFYRAPIELTGRVMDARARDFDCRTIDVSPGDVLFASPAPVQVGEWVIAYVDQLGRIVGRVSRVPQPGAFAIVAKLTTHKREKIAETLIALMNPDAARAGDGDQRRMKRYEGGGAAAVSLQSGETIPVEILDFSLVGASLKAVKRPPLGDWVQLGALHGRVARYTEQGFAIDFEARPPR